MIQKLSLEGEAIGHDFEALSLIAYPDPGSRDGTPWTIGYGHTKGVKKGDKCTKAQAEQWFREDVAWAEAAVNAERLSLTQAEFDALVLFVFNIGAAAFKQSTMLKLLKAGDKKAAKEQFKRWNKNDGKVMLGLVRRRRAEEERFSGATATVAIAIGRSVDKIA